MLKINGTGCCILDYICSSVNLNENPFRSLVSGKTGDGGIVPGGLVLMEDLVQFSQKEEKEIRNLIMEKASSVSTNLGGVGIVPLIHISQMINGAPGVIAFYQYCGTDKTGEELLSFLKKNNISLKGYQQIPGSSPETLVLSSEGERSFICRMGMGGIIEPKHLPASFYTADIFVYGATALSPHLHKELDLVLLKARPSGGLNCVLTVHDFYSEKTKPGEPWIMGQSSETYSLIDLLIGNKEEALGLSGKKVFREAVQTLRAWGLKNMIFTDGGSEIFYSCRKPLFSEDREGSCSVPNLQKMKTILSFTGVGDTTGCGDNFAGGVLYSLYKQIENSGRKEALDIEEMLKQGIAAGTLSCFYSGGVFHESRSGEKKEFIEKIYSEIISTVPF